MSNMWRPLHVFYEKEKHEAVMVFQCKLFEFYFHLFLRDYNLIIQFLFWYCKAQLNTVQNLSLL